MTACWKSVPPQERLRRREALQAVADRLHRSAEVALDRNSDLAFALDRVRDRVRDLVRDLGGDLALIRARDRDRDLENVNVSDLTRAFILTDALERARARARRLDRALDGDLGRITLDLARALDFDSFDLDRALELAHDLADACDPARLLDRARDLTRELDGDLKLTRDLARDFGIDDRVRDLGDLAFDVARARDLTRHLTRDRGLIEAHGNLVDAANNFVGADFSTVDPSEVNLVGIRWDSDTRWPTPEWTARIRRASVEDPPGSGVFIVLPEEGHNFVDRDSLAPIS